MIDARGLTAFAMRNGRMHSRSGKAFTSFSSRFCQTRLLSHALHLGIPARSASNFVAATCADSAERSSSSGFSAPNTNSEQGGTVLLLVCRPSVHDLAGARLPMFITGHPEGQYKHEHTSPRPPPKGHSVVLLMCLRSRHASAKHPGWPSGHARSPLRTGSRSVCDLVQANCRFLFHPFGNRGVEE